MCSSLGLSVCPSETSACKGNVKQKLLQCPQIQYTATCATSSLIFIPIMSIQASLKNGKAARNRIERLGRLDDMKQITMHGMHASAFVIPEDWFKYQRDHTRLPTAVYSLGYLTSVTK